MSERETDAIANSFSLQYKLLSAAYQLTKVVLLDKLRLTVQRMAAAGVAPN